MTRSVATALIAIAMALSLTCARLAAAEVAEVKLALQNGSNYLPLMVMQQQKLVEKHLAAKGRGRDKERVTPQQPAGVDGVKPVDIFDRINALLRLDGRPICPARYLNTPTAELCAPGLLTGVKRSDGGHPALSACAGP